MVSSRHTEKVWKGAAQKQEARTSTVGSEQSIFGTNALPMRAIFLHTQLLQGSSASPSVSGWGTGWGWATRAPGSCAGSGPDSMHVS